MNIAEIAKRAGVSSAAVSRFFNGGYLSEEKKNAVQRVVEETGYRPSLQAQMLRTKKTKMIGVIAPKMVSDSVGSMVEGILKVLNEVGYHMLLAVTEGNAEKELEYLAAFGEKQVDGVLVMGTAFSDEHKKALDEMTVPVVIMAQQLEGHACVFHDDYHAIYDITKRFLEMGRKNLVYMSAFHEDRSAGWNRYCGYRDAVREMGHEELAEQYEVVDFDSFSGYRKAKELLEIYPDMDGLICASDEMATGALRYLNERQIPVPEQILVSGLGDSAIAKMANPSLWSIHYSYHTCGETATQMLLDMIRYRREDKSEIMLGYKILEQKYGSPLLES